MAVCVCCSRDRSDVKIRVGLRTIDRLRKITTKPFHSPLCDECLTKVSRIGSIEQRWVLLQIMRNERERHVVQKPSGNRRGDVVVSFRPARAKPTEPRP